MITFRARLGAVLCVLLVTGSACASGPETSGPGTSGDTASSPPANPYEDERRAGVEQLLTAWADAVRNNDPDAVARLVDSAAPPEFLRAQVERAAALATVPLSDWGYELVDEPETPVPSATAQPIGAADVWAPSVVLRYALDGPDEVPTRRPVALLVAKRDDRWRLVSDTEIPGIDRRTWRGPWDYGAVSTARVETAGGVSLVVGHPEQAALMSELATELPTAVNAVTDFWGGGWSRKAVLFTAGSTEEFLASVGSTGAGANTAAVTVSDAVVPDAPVSGQRIVFSPAAVDRLTAFTTRSVLRHELAHVAARAETVDGSPTWLLEGFADYVGYRGSGAEFGSLAPTLSRLVAAGGPPSVLPADTDFAAGGTRTTLAYESSWSIAAFVADRFGEPALRALYERLATGPQSASAIDDAMSQVLGPNTAGFIDEWGAWVVQNAA